MELAQPSVEAPAYVGRHMLVKAEDNLRNYNCWIVDSFIRHGKIGPQTKVLDFGCGIGTLSAILREKTGVAPDGVEPDALQRSIFASRGFTAYPDLAEIDQSYDVIFTSNVLEHIPDDGAALRALRHLLVPGGRLLIFVPAFELIWTGMDDVVGHCRRYTRTGLRATLHQAGFEVERDTYRDSVGFLLALVFKLLGPSSGEPSDRSLRLFDRLLLPFSKALDIAVGWAFGKNVLAVAHRPSRD